MLRMHNRRLTPGSGWVYPVPETKFEVTGNSLDELVSNVIKHLAVNDHKIPVDLDLVIEDHIARQMPAKYSHESQAKRST